ncbi:hypothetical protein KIL84_002470 [Mauremys mutica]|uniref:Uncharacterized protein n=1 Tax=Mauremys mutica TaxID=74926 RepID=A0A9D3X7G5_9SAUR|nr:hypothetical protein KIL84_002470 [Mauremys mutica]
MDGLLLASTGFASALLCPRPVPQVCHASPRQAAAPPDEPQPRLISPAGAGSSRGPKLLLLYKQAETSLGTQPEQLPQGPLGPKPSSQGSQASSLAHLHQDNLQLNPGFPGAGWLLAGKSPPSYPAQPHCLLPPPAAQCLGS